MKKLFLIAGVFAAMTLASCSKECHCTDTTTNQDVTNDIILQYDEDMCNSMNSMSMGVWECKMQ